ncbi:MAG: methanogenesis marker 12 protein [Methanobacteriaceae archaeon]|nr:methanogenesis marker 12 protein [Methanobacteriaceae archaeon]
MYYLGMDHGTTAVSFTILNNKRKPINTFSLNRRELSNKKVSFKEELKKYVNPNKIKLMGVTYGMGDKINTIQPLDKVKDKGILSINGAGKVTGGGSYVYNDIEDMNINSIIIPGLHKNSLNLDKRFRQAYSHCASSEKISLSYFAYDQTKWKNMIIADISSNTVSILVQNSKIVGAMDACIGAMGLIHGPLDLSMIRKIDSNQKTANQCFSNAGIVKLLPIENKITNIKNELVEGILENDKKYIDALDTMIMTIVMEIYGLYGISKNIDGIVLTGSIGSMIEPINISKIIKEKIEDLAPVKILTKDSGSIGSALIAYDILEKNKKSILGIPVTI